MSKNTARPFFAVSAIFSRAVLSQLGERRKDRAEEMIEIIPFSPLSSTFSRFYLRFWEIFIFLKGARCLQTSSLEGCLASREALFASWFPAPAR